MSWKITKTAEKLMNIDNEVWDELGFRSRPTGRDRQVYLETIIPRIKRYKVGRRVEDDLIDWNFHSLVVACRIARGDMTIEEVMEEERAMCERYGTEW